MDKSIRKSVKKMAFEEPKGVHVKAFVIYFLILSFISYIGMDFINDSNLVVLLSFIVTMPLYLNFVKICLDSSRDILIDTRQLFEIKKYSFKFSLYYTLVLLVFYLFNVILGLIGIFGFIISMVITIYLIPIFIIMPLVFLDDVKISLADFIMKSAKLIDKRRIVFYGLLCSFLVWFLLGFLTFGILFIWLIPYIYISVAYFYLNLKKEKTFEKQKALSDMVIIVLFLIFMVVINIISFKMYPDSLDSFMKSMMIK